MTPSQFFVVLWIQFAVATAVLLGAARLLLRFIRQPAEQIRLIQLTMGATLAIPFVMVVSPWPIWRLEILALNENVAAAAGAGKSPASIRLVGSDTHEPAFFNENDSNIPLHTKLDPLANTNVSNSTPGTHPAITRPTAHGKILPKLSVWSIAAALIIGIHAVVLVVYLTEWYLGATRLRVIMHNAGPETTSLLTVWNNVTQGRGAKVRLFVSPMVDTPLTFGWKQPVVIVPQRVSDADATTMGYCLSHEWSHIDRADILTWRALWACQFVLWYQPLFWTLRRELRICQDILADCASAPGRDDAISYSELLLGFAKSRKSLALAGALMFFDRPSQLMRRISMLLEERMKVRAACSWKCSLALVVVAALTTCLVTGVRLEAARSDAKGPEQEVTEPVGHADDKATSADAKEESPVEPKRPVVTEDQSPNLVYRCIVVDKTTGEGIANAKVTVVRSNFPSGGENEELGETHHVTDANGKYTVEIPPEQSSRPALYIVVRVDHDDYVRYPGGGYSLSMIRKNETLGERPFFERMELNPADPVTGKVLTPDGNPAVGVKINGFTAATVGDFRNFCWLESETGEDGSFRLKLIRGGPAAVWFVPNDYAIAQMIIEKERGELGEIRLTQGIRISGRVLTADGKPAAGVAVNASYQEKENNEIFRSVASGIRRGAITDDDGGFRLDPLPPGDFRIVPEDQIQDPRKQGHEKVYALPGVFVGQKVTLKDGVAPAAIELQALPHVMFHVQYVTSTGEKTRGHEFFIGGQLDGQFWSARARPDAEGTAHVRVPHGLQDTQVTLMTNEHSALRVRPGLGKQILNDYHNVRLGTLNDDVEGFEVIRYKAPIVLVQAVDEGGKPIKPFQVAAKYSRTVSSPYILEGELRSDVSFERQDDGRHRTSQMLPDEEVTFTAMAKGHESTSEKVVLAEGETKELVLTLKKAAETKQE